MDESLHDLVRELGRRARVASRALGMVSSSGRRDVLHRMADVLEEDGRRILEANAGDMEVGRKSGLSRATLDRLMLDERRLKGMASAIREVAELPDPVGEVISSWVRPNGLEISKVRVPIGVVGIIYESRPNVTADAASLCVKTGNAVLLRGGSESLRSNLAIVEALRRGLERGGVAVDAVQMVPVTDREAVREMARMDEFLDVIVPRGGHALIEAVVAEARMPVIKHYEGICAVYVDRGADVEMAAAIAVNAKCQRPGVCNAMETLLVHEGVAGDFWRAVSGGFEEFGVEVRGDNRTLEILKGLGYSKVRAVEQADWRTEYLDMIVAAKTVSGLEEAIEHINFYGSHHSDSIVTRDRAAAEKFLAEVDSAVVYWNASTRFTDGGEFGFGAEVGISTDKLHARGPMGLAELTTYKYVVRGDGQVRK